MRAKAPGKIVLSGAYSVLEGAPAIVCAVNRYVLADASRTADFLTDEVRAARLCPVPWYDASALRSGDRKLGLGSSAAILAASLAADLLTHEPGIDTTALAAFIYPKALKAHAMVQPLGSGIDVCATCFGGTRIIRRHEGTLEHSPAPLPSRLCFEVWAAPKASSTGAMLAILSEYRKSRPADYSRHIQHQADASERAAAALLTQDAEQLILALSDQRAALQDLGHAAGLCIVTEEVAILADTAATEAAAVLPAGAGGGDVAIYVGQNPPSEKLKRLMVALHHEPLNVALGSPGVHSLAAEC